MGLTWSSRRARRCERLWPEALAILTGCLRAGLPLEEALAVMAAESPEPLRSEFKRRWENMGAWVPVQARVEQLFQENYLTLPRLTLLIGTEWGGDVCHVLDVSVGLLRKKMEMKERLDLLTVNGRFCAWVVAASPFALLGLLSVMSPEFIAPLFASGAGRRLLAFVVLLVGAGLWMVQRIARADE